ncbi:MAG: ribonuclease R [Sandaracinaceae bacterium]|nr:ribonuclease R [Sandaracinaceae bacterium]
MTHDIGRDAVLAVLADRGPRAMHLMEVLAQLGLETHQRDALRDVLDELTGLGMAQEMPGSRFRVARRARGDEPRAARPDEVDVTGWLTLHPRGFGFVAAEDGGPDVFVAGSALGNALHRDRVRVRARPSAKGREGEVQEVLRRGVGRVAGVLRTSGERAWLEPSDPRVPSRVDVVGTMPLGLRDGDEVVAQIAKWPALAGDVMEARVLGSLGARGSAAVEVEKIKIREGVEEEQPEDAVLEAQAFGTEVRASDLEGREDLRPLDLVTIDPPTARDHDDAVWAERLEDGAFRVVVAIADVSHYVRPGSALDRAALDRCTSIYLPDRVIPMLPHELSSNLASLVPDEDRLVLAVEVEVGKTGTIRGHRFLEGVMRSRARISYGGVARALGLSSEQDEEPEAEARRPLLATLFEVSKLLRAKRRRRGSLDFDLPEAVIDLDESGEPVDVRRSRTDPGLRAAYGMIEDLMLLANEVVAEDLARRGVPTIYRVHGRPDEAKVEAFAALAESLGYSIAIDSDGGIAAFLRKVEGKEHAQALSFLLLRAMQQATYQTENIGHFALAARHYLHFTSPIRRYPDLAVHRVVRAVLRGERVNKAELAQTLAAQATQCARLERRALTIDREVTDLYRVLLMRDRVGEEFDAQITGVAEHGIYVAFDEPFVEARVRIDTLGDDWYELDPLGLRLVGRRSGHAFSLGDRLLVRLEGASVEERALTAVIVPGSEGAEPRRSRPRPTAKTRREESTRRRPSDAKGPRGRVAKAPRGDKGKPKKATRKKRR